VRKCRVTYVSQSSRMDEDAWHHWTVLPFFEVNVLIKRPLVLSFNSPSCTWKRWPPTFLMESI